MTMPPSFPAPPLHPIFRPAAHLIPPPGQPLALSSAVSLFAVLSKDHIILTYQNSQYESHVSASADVLSAQMILK
ncbi:uncharacterized protein BDCG_16729 [Blastomyces dermatitidis ER-3]|uniref:Uncharacterized protein n=1 Tax=Ajellomyces dermatitidis (strain ER-3 / ATCC MYA-2586) TaxID=559297 RepID=A0ABX2VU06_AJEDR|nr:uncharacterized protein BDCG_16729 [Blastomyces dermatitidis ER-3]OAT00668.1 hypothetical protein BDCG_16729 [Blastomyces dermatitidis ER-3]